MNLHSLLFCSLAAVLTISAQAQQRPTKPNTSLPIPAEGAQLYRNSALGFRYRIRYGWVDRTKEMQEQGKPAESESAKSQDRSKGDNPPRESANGEVLLAVFERPPEAAGDTVNSAVVIASEETDLYPDLKRAEDYLDQLDEITTAKGFKPDGDAEEVTIDSRSLVRADFTRALNDKLTMYQSTLVLLAKKQIVSFTFIAGNKDEIEDLIDALSFPSGAVRKHP